MATVYIDVLFLVNFIINILLIEASGAITSTPSVWYRTIFAAALGALYAVCMFFPNLALLYTFVMKVVLSGFIVLCAYRVHGLRHFFTLWGAFYASSFVFGGCVIALMSMTKLGEKTGAVYSNGVVYFDMPWQVLIGSTAVAYFFVIMVGRVRKRRVEREQIKRDVEISINGVCARLCAIIDTGNSLFDPITGEPVIVCEYEGVKNLLIGTDEKKSLIERMSESGMKVRFVPFSSVGQSHGMLAGFKPDNVKVDGEVTNSCIVCICEQKLSSQREYKALLNPQLLAQKQ